MPQKSKKSTVEKAGCRFFTIFFTTSLEKQTFKGVSLANLPSRWKAMNIFAVNSIFVQSGLEKNDPGNILFIEHFCSKQHFCSIMVWKMNIDRDQYLNELLLRRHNGMIKIITGIRRSGKSYLLLKLFHERLVKEGVPQGSVSHCPPPKRCFYRASFLDQHR